MKAAKLLSGTASSVASRHKVATLVLVGATVGSVALTARALWRLHKRVSRGGRHLRIAIVGGGLSGAAVATALRAKGFQDVQVFESGPASAAERVHGPTGAASAVPALVDAASAQALRAMGAREALDDATSCLLGGTTAVYGHDGVRALSTATPQTALGKLLARVLRLPRRISRVRLVQGLLGTLPASHINYNTQVVGVSPVGGHSGDDATCAPDGVRLVFADGVESGSLPFDLVVAANGAQSLLRRTMVHDTHHGNTDDAQLESYSGYSAVWGQVRRPGECCAGTLDLLGHGVASVAELGVAAPTDAQGTAQLAADEAKTPNGEEATAHAANQPTVGGGVLGAATATFVGAGGSMVMWLRQDPCPGDGASQQPLTWVLLMRAAQGAMFRYLSKDSARGAGAAAGPGAGGVAHPSHVAGVCELLHAFFPGAAAPLQTVVAMSDWTTAEELPRHPATPAWRRTPLLDGRAPNARDDPSAVPRTISDDSIGIADAVAPRHTTVAAPQAATLGDNSTATPATTAMPLLLVGNALHTMPPVPSASAVTRAVTQARAVADALAAIDDATPGTLSVLCGGDDAIRTWRAQVVGPELAATQVACLRASVEARRSSHAVGRAWLTSTCDDDLAILQAEVRADTRRATPTGPMSESKGDVGGVVGVPVEPHASDPAAAPSLSGSSSSESVHQLAAGGDVSDQDSDEAARVVVVRGSHTTAFTATGAGTKGAAAGAGAGAGSSDAGHDHVRLGDAGDAGDGTGITEHVALNALDAPDSYEPPTAKWAPRNGAARPMRASRSTCGSTGSAVSTMPAGSATIADRAVSDVGYSHVGGTSTAVLAALCRAERTFIGPH